MSKSKSKSKKTEATGQGHNSLAKEALLAYVERIERLKEEKSGIADDIKDVFAEAKGNGYDLPTMREMLKLRALDAMEREEKEHLRDLYMQALALGPDMLT